MLTVFDQPTGMSRRNFLRVGSLGLGLASMLASGRVRRAGADTLLVTNAGLDRSRLLTGKSVVFLFMHGGPSQIETFDPKMDAPSEYRSVTGDTATNIPGIRFGGTFQKLAGLADKLAIVRSFATGSGNHDIKPIVCAETLGANLGSVLARVMGPTRSETGMPVNALLFPQAVDPTAQPGVRSFGQFASSGRLGSQYAPFEPGGDGQLQSDMRLNVPMTRLDDRRGLLRQLDRLRWELEAHAESVRAPSDDFEKLRNQALSVLLGRLGEVFDLQRESRATLARYDTAPLINPESIRSDWKNRRNYIDHSQTLGKLMLLARRLCEAGAGFVTVTTNFVWDMHSDVNNAPMDVGMDYVGRPFDHAVSAFIEDIEARGLSDKILLVATGEMGRTPKISKKGGRDHWGKLAPLMLYGGGLRTGQVIGQSDRFGGEPAETAVGIRELISTILHTVFDVGQLRLVPGLPRELLAMTEWSPIPGLLR